MRTTSPTLIEAHKAFVARWDLTYPLHSTKIRGARDNFTWIGKDKARGMMFLADLEALLISLPVVGIACVVHRPGYISRYSARYQGNPWQMCKTAHAILLERAAKFALGRGAELEVFFEAAGEAEDRNTFAYTKLLKTSGMPFEGAGSGAYDGLRPEDFKRILVGDPNRVTKKSPMMQLADLYLYPMVKGGYDSTYQPYRNLLEASRLIDAHIQPEERPRLGIKYSCFDPA
jgi:hypothetical protein